MPLGISFDEIRFVLDYYGEVLPVQQVTKFMFGKRTDTGYRVVIFKKLYKDIPSYLLARGWKAFIMYTGQPKTCRICEKACHFAKDCPSNSRRKPDEKPAEDQGTPVNMETACGSQPTRSSEEPKDLTNTSKNDQVIMEILDTLAEIVHVPEPDSMEKLHTPDPDPVILTGTPTIQETHMDDIQSEPGSSSVLKDSSNQMNTNSAEEIKVNKGEQATSKSCSCGMSWCPQSPKMDSRSDAEHTAASSKQMSNMKSRSLRTVSGVGLLSGKAKARGSNTTSSGS